MGYYQLFKTILERQLQDFLGLFFPDITASHWHASRRKSMLERVRLVWRSQL